MSRGHLRPVHDEPGDVLVDVDGDGEPDRITPADRAAGHDPARLNDTITMHRADILAAGEMPGDDEAPGAELELAPRRQNVLVAPTTSVSVKPGELLPVLPPWLRSRKSVGAMARWYARRAWHASRFHGVRLPVYTGKVAVFAPWGVVCALVWVFRWAVDWRADSIEQLLATGTKHDADTYLKLRRDRSRRVKGRMSVVAAFALLGLAGIVLVEAKGPAWGPRVLLVALVLTAARLGSPAGSPLVAATMAASSGYRVLTDVIVMRALRHAGLGGTAPKVDAKTGASVGDDTRATLAAPIMRAENGSGYLVTVDLPYGSTAEDAMEKSDRIASGLDIDGTQLFLEKVPGSKRRVTMYVADEDPFLLPARRSPLIKLPTVSVWDEHPLGIEPRGRETTPCLMFNSFGIGAIPRSGKTFSARPLVGPAILDPYCDMSVLDFKGGRDWKALEPICVHFQTGDEDEDLIAAVGALERFKRDAQDRFKKFRDMSDEENPEGKLTPELARHSMRPHVIVIDEVQNLLRAQNKVIAAQALSLLVWLVKTAPAAGFSVVWLTQRPATDVIPSDLRDNTSVRIALRTKTWQGSDAILGAGINAAGFGTQRFLEQHKGAAIVGGVSNGRGGDLSVIRTDLIELRDLTRMVRAGRMRREDAGTLRGMAAGVVPDVVVTVTVVEDVIAAWPGDTSKVQAAELLPRLRELFPERYGAWDPENDTGELTRALSEHGVKTVQVNRRGLGNRNGYALNDVRRAAAKELEGR